MLKWLGCAIAGACIAMASAAQAETVLRYNRWLPPTHHIDTQVHKVWFEKIAEVTQNRVKVEFTTSSLGALPRQYDLAATGVADIVFGSESLTPGRFALPEILEMPFLGRSTEAVAVAYWRTYKKHFEKANEYKEVKLLALGALPTYNIYNARRPVVSLADLDGMKIRAGGALLNEMVAALGAVAVPAQITELHDLLSKGVVDGTIWSDDGIRSFNLVKYVAHRTEIPGGLSSYSTFTAINKAKWEKLSAEDRAAIEAISGENYARALGRALDESSKLGVEQMREAGTKFATADAKFVEEIRERLADMEAAWIKKAETKGVDGAAALKMLREEAANYKAPQ